jgi:hypothetical protein
MVGHLVQTIPLKWHASLITYFFLKHGAQLNAQPSKKKMVGHLDQTIHQLGNKLCHTHYVI